MLLSKDRQKASVQGTRTKEEQNYQILGKKGEAKENDGGCHVTNPKGANYK